MPKKKSTKKVNKTAAIRAYLSEHPNAKPSEATEALKQQGFDISPGYFSMIKSTLNKKQPGKKVARKGKTTSANPTDLVSLDSMLEAKKFVVEVGGIEKARHLVDALAKVMQ